MNGERNMQHKKIYKAFFKCRLCGEIFSTVTTENRIMATKIVSHICTNTNSDIALAPDSKETHMCKDGGIGMADFLGFNDTVTKADKIEKAFKISMNIPNVDVDVDIDSVAQKMSEKISKQIQQETQSVTEDEYKYKKYSAEEVRRIVNLSLIFERQKTKLARDMQTFMDEINRKGDAKMSNDKFLSLCKEKVVEYFNGRADKTDKKLITEEDVFIIWSCKTLQNNKALVSTTVSDGMYYEITYNGDKNELYFDAYKKWENIKFDVED